MEYRDLRPGLARAPWSIGRRAGPPTGATLHYNGPPVAGADDVSMCFRQLQADARYHMRPDTLGADGIQYHYAALPDGSIACLRDEHDVLWHAANTTANAWHLAVHLPLGGAQAPTPAQWAATSALLDALIVRHGWAGRQAIRGHREWPRSDGKPQKSCPGPIVFRLLTQWRGQLAGPASYRVAVGVALIREGPGQAFRVALGGTAKLPCGAEAVVDTIVDGAAPRGSTDPRWAHLASGVGFVHLSLLEAL